MSRAPYPSDLTDAEWELLRPLVPEAPPNPGTEPYDRREIVNAIRYAVRTGVQWRYLPHDLPEWHSAYGYFSRWRDDGTWERIQQALRPKARAASGRKPDAHLVIVDSQTTKTTESGGPRGYDGNKKMLGRKRHAAVDSVGLPITHLVTPANQHDARPAPDLIQKAKEKEPELEVGIGDKAYKGKRIREAAARVGVRFEAIDGEPSTGKFVPIKHRWKVERTFAWNGRNRRLSRDYERTIESSESVMAVASIGILLHRSTTPIRRELG